MWTVGTDLIVGMGSRSIAEEIVGSDSTTGAGVNSTLVIHVEFIASDGIGAIVVVEATSVVLDLMLGCARGLQLLGSIIFLGKQD